MIALVAEQAKDRAVLQSLRGDESARILRERERDQREQQSSKERERDREKDERRERE